MPLAKETKMLESWFCEFLNFSLCLILKILAVTVGVCECEFEEMRMRLVTTSNLTIRL